MIEKNLLKEVGKMAIGLIIMCVITAAMFLVLGYFSYQVIFGLCLGYLVCMLNYSFLAYCVGKAVDKDVNKAKAYISGTYGLRMILIAVTIIVAIRNPKYFNYIATAIPFLFPRIIITLTNMFKKKEDAKE